ncbi:MAG: cohesin domain-containing protein [Bacteroidota bacterium]
MNPYLTHFFVKCLLVISMAICFVRCGTDDPARTAAKKEALKNPKPPTATPAPADETTPTRPPEVGKLPMQIASAQATGGEEVCVPVTVAQFIGIVSMQYTMTFDPTVLKFKTIRNFGLPGMTIDNFGARAADKGILAYSWFDADVQGISMPDGTKLYDVCFETIGESGTSSTVEFADAPVVIEISNSASQFLGIDGTNGRVSIE